VILPRELSSGPHTGEELRLIASLESSIPAFTNLPLTLSYPPTPVDVHSFISVPRSRRMPMHMISAHVNAYRRRNHPCHNVSRYMGYGD